MRLCALSVMFKVFPETELLARDDSGRLLQPQERGTVLPLVLAANSQFFVNSEVAERGNKLGIILTHNPNSDSDMVHCGSLPFSGGRSQQLQRHA